MEVALDSRPAPGQSQNEDLAVAGPSFAFVLDGATAPPGVDSGCRHSVAWLVRNLGGELARVLAHEEAMDLADALAVAITRTRDRHAGSCDLDNPASPSSTVAIVRETAATVDYLVLADSPVVIRAADGAVVAINDTRNDRFSDRSPEDVSVHRNVPGGFWVASTRPEAAHEALLGSLSRDRVITAGIFSDGASRLAERHGLTWGELLALLEERGPSRVITDVRHADGRLAPGTYPGKVHDDATAVLCRFHEHP